MKKTAIAVMGAVALSGCATMQPYQSATSGPRATLNFISPTLEGNILSDTDLDLHIFEADKNCKKTAKGRLELEPDKKSATTQIPSGKYVFLSIRYFQNCFGCGSRSGGEQFGFLPEDGKEYTIEFEDNAINYSVRIHEGTATQKTGGVKAVRWNSCSSLDQDKL